VIAEVESTIGLDCKGALRCSAKTGLGIESILEAVVKTLPSPKGDRNKPLRALIFDSYYDSYRGVVVFFRVVDGEIRKGDKIRFMNSNMEYEVLEVGVMTPKQVREGEKGRKEKRERKSIEPNLSPCLY
jgi:GTP-binding protein LepA